MVAISVVTATLESRRDVEPIAILEEHAFDDYEVILCDESPVTRARNAGVERADGDKIVFLDDDSEPEPGYLERANEVLENEAAYAGRTVHAYDDMFRKHFTNHYDWGPEPLYVDSFWGCNMGIRRDVFETVGGWDEEMGWGHEERELASRVRDRFQIRYDPDLVVKHPYTSSIVEYWRKQYRLERNRPYLWTKCDVTQGEQARRIISDALNPGNYVRRTPMAAVTQAGSTVARTAGRVRGYLEQRRGDADETRPDVKA